MHRFKALGPAVLLALSVAGLDSVAQAKSCFAGKDAVNAAQVASDEAAIKGNPGAWFAAKGGGVTKAVRDIAGSDPDFAATIVSQHKGAPGAAGVGAGLGQARIACSAFTDEAGKIQTAASGSSEDALVASFNTTIGSAQSGSTGGGGGGGGDGSGIGGANTASTSGTGSSGSRSDPGGSTGTANRFSSLLTSFSGTSTSGASVNEVTTQAAQAASVNP